MHLPAKYLISENKARNILLGIWSSCFLANLGVAFYLYSKGSVESDNFNSLMSRLNSLYVTYLGVMIAFYLTRRPQTRVAAVDAPSMEVVHPLVTKAVESNSHVSFIIAAFGSTVWNLIILVFVGRLLFGIGYVEETIIEVESFGSLLSWIVAPSIGFYFGKINSPQ